MTRDSDAPQSAVPVIVKAIVTGLVVGMIPANVWLVFLVVLRLPVPAAVVAELLFLAVYVWWARGGGPPRQLQAARADAFRVRRLTARQWAWGVVAAISFAVTVHAAISLLFRFVPFQPRRSGRATTFPTFRPASFSISPASYRPCRRVCAKRSAFAATCSGRSKSGTAS